MQLKQYQETAIKELLDKAKKLLGYTGNKKMVFKAPTGSGKTIMMAEFLKRLVDDRSVKTPLSFIWAAPRQLHIQSRGKLETYFEDTRVLKCSFFEDLDDIKIDQNEILFFNWESINREDNIYIRDNERDNNLSNALDKTKSEGRQIILVIDECHHHATSDISQGLIQMIDPKLTIEVSATPVVTGPDETITAQLDDVKAEGMIKKAVLLNPEFENIFKNGKIESRLNTDTEDIVIDAALKKRKELAGLYDKQANINPLMLIQLPDRIGSLEDTMKEKVIAILKDKYHISTENGKLAIWLSGEHINKENVEKADSEVEVLIFKQAIALGWDCPRAQILVLFREWHSPVFSIQTVGRIMRMPEPDKGHYPEEPLNYGYVYTNLEHIDIQEDMARNYITIHTSRRKSTYKPVNLRSCHSLRQREQTRLASLFIDVFLHEADSYDLKKKIDKKDRQLNTRVISDYKAEDVDKLAGKFIIADKAIEASSTDLQKLFDFFVRKHLTPFYPEDRSVGRVKEAVYRFFARDLAMFYQENQDEIVQIVLSDKNMQDFINVIDKAKESYIKEVIRREPKIEFDENWDVPETERFNENYTKDDKKKSIMEPFFIKGEWQTEKHFIDFLEKAGNVEWWFKNGDRDAVYFAVPYEMGGKLAGSPANRGKPAPFYVDFVVKMKDGRIGLFDPHGLHLSDAKPKSEGLYNYIQAENKKDKKLFGGIVANTQANYSGAWYYFDKPIKDWRDNDLGNWTVLEL